MFRAGNGIIFLILNVDGDAYDYNSCSLNYEFISEPWFISKTGLSL
jgi:hypothetical protein